MEVSCDGKRPRAPAEVRTCLWGALEGSEGEIGRVKKEKPYRAARRVALVFTAAARVS